MTIAADLEFMTAAEFAVIFQGRARQLAWFLGAGASAAGGIPTGYDMITEFKARVFCRDTGLAFREIDPADPLWLARIEDHAARSPTLPPPGGPDEYSAYFEEIYPGPADRRNFIDEKLSRASPSYAHRVLAAVICSRQSSVVFTTNFDQLVETSCTAADELLEPADRARINVADLQRVDVAQRCEVQGDWPLLVKLHGDYQSENLKNISNELVVQDEHLRQVMVNLCGDFGLVVVGYSGRDESVMEALGAALIQPSSFPAGIFWVTRPESTLLPAVSEWLTAAKAAAVEVHLVEAENFDELMGVTERQLTLPEALSEHVRGARPAARVTPVAMPVPSGQQFPALRTSALPVLEHPLIARRVALRQRATTRELREVLREADRGRHVAIAAIAGGAAAFGPDDDLLQGLSALGPKIDGEVALDPGADSWAHGLLYDALVHALARGRPARPVPGRHLVVLQPPPQHWNDPAAEASRQELAGDRCWAMLDAKMERSRGVQWPQWCPLPAGAVYWMAQKATANREFERSVYESLAPMIHAIALWRHGQGVYRFDDHLAAELLDTPLSSGLPAEVLTRLPEWCPLIVAPQCEGWPSEFAGVFVCHSWNASAKRRELRLVYIPTQVATPLISILPLNAATLGEALDMWRDQIMREASEKGRDPEELEALFMQSRAVVTKALGLVLYLCAENAEIQALDGQGSPVAQPTEPSVSDRHRELLVGYRTGPLLAGRQRSDRSVVARGHSPEPHLRRAHWHHYWVGAADDPERRLELRWISPTLVGGRPERPRVRDLDSPGTPQ